MDRRRVAREQPQPPPEPPGPQPPGGPPQPPEPQPSPFGLAPKHDAAAITLASGMPGQREGRPTTISEAALQLTLKWMDHSSDAAALALGDPELAEAQAQSVVTFFSNVFHALQPHFPTAGDGTRDRRER